MLSSVSANDFNSIYYKKGIIKEAFKRGWTSNRFLFWNQRYNYSFIGFLLARKPIRLIL